MSQALLCHPGAFPSITLFPERMMLLVRFSELNKYVDFTGLVFSLLTERERLSLVFVFELLTLGPR